MPFDLQNAIFKISTPKIMLTNFNKYFSYQLLYDHLFERNRKQNCCFKQFLINHINIIVFVKHQTNNMLSQNQESIFELEEFNREDQSISNQSIRVRSQKRNYDGFTEGQWKIQQNLIYVIFMDIYQLIFNSKSKRKFSKIFTNLANYLKTRNASQCRSHFQKLMSKHKTLKNIFRFYKTQVGEHVYQEKYFSMQKELSILQQKAEQSAQSEAKCYADQAVQTDDLSFQNVIDPRNFFCFDQQSLYHNFCMSQNQFIFMNGLLRQSLEN